MQGLGIACSLCQSIAVESKTASDRWLTVVMACVIAALLWWAFGHQLTGQRQTVDGVPVVAHTIDGSVVYESVDGSQAWAPMENWMVPRAQAIQAKLDILNANRRAKERAAHH